MKYPAFILLLLISITVQGQTTIFPKIVANQSRKMVKGSFTESQQWLRKVKYLGPAKDTIYLSEDNYSIIESNILPLAIQKTLDHYSFECENCINIAVDTTQILALFEAEWKKNKLRDINYQSYPVLIENMSDSIYKIGFGHNVRILVEALDTDNTWKPIETHFMYRCGTGLTDLYLHGHQIACVLVPIYHGNFKTLLRLNLNNHFSKPFLGSINRKQFNKPIGIF